MVAMDWRRAWCDGSCIIIDIGIVGIVQVGEARHKGWTTRKATLLREVTIL